MSFYITGWLFVDKHKDTPIDIKPSLNMDLNNYDNNELSDFLLGYLDSYGYIDLDNKKCVLISNELINYIIINKLKIPFEIDSNNIIFSNINLIDFLGTIYTNNKEKLYINNNFLLFKSIIKCDMPIINFFKSDNNAIIPYKNNFSDVGLDISIISIYKKINYNTIMYDTGIKCDIPVGYYIEIVPRSSIIKTGYILSNNVGIIDSSYKGNIYICLTKISYDSIKIIFPFKCCQLILKKQIFPTINEITEINEINITKRNYDGFGSTS
jgi:deoxyuridine 5'-triphosphate nucleotidohydrolase